MNVTSFKKSFTFSKEETDIKKNILLDNFRAEFKDISASYAVNYLFMEKKIIIYRRNTYLKRRHK